MRRCALAIIVALLALGAAVSSVPTAAALSRSSEGELVIRPSDPPGLALKGACGVAVDTDGRTFVSSYYGHAIYVFNAKREYEGNFEVKQPPLPLPQIGKVPGGPCDLALDADGNLYVNRWHHDVIKLPRLNPGPTAFGPAIVIDSNAPTSVTFDPQSGHLFIDDRTYVAEYQTSGAPVLDGDGEPVKIGLGSLGEGYGVAVSGFTGDADFDSTAGLVYVADAADETVKVYDPSKPADPPQVIDGADTPLLRFNHLADSDVAVDRVDGHVFIVDNLKPGFELPEAVVHEYSPGRHYRGPVPPTAANGGGSGVVHGEPTAVAIFEHRVFVTSGNYFDDNDVDTHDDSRVLIFGPTPKVEARILTATKTGAGAGTVFSSSPGGLGCGTACKGEFTLGTTVILAALPAPHSRFVEWTDCEPRVGGAPTECQLRMDKDQHVSAEFEPIPQRQLTVAKSGSGAGSVSSLPSGIDCGSVCAAEFDEGSEVTLTAMGDQHSAFTGWSGCDSEPAPGKCAVMMSAGRSVTASFDAVIGPPPPPPPAPGRRTLSVLATGTGVASGTVTSVPAGIACGAICAQAFAQGATVTLVAQPAPGSAFLGWGGCDGAAAERCTVALGSDRSVVAAFGPGPPGPLRLRGLAVHGDSATLRVSVPAAGTLSASGPGLRPVSALPLAAGRVALALRLTAAARRSLAESQRQQLRVRVALAFVPFDGGAPVRATRAVTFGGGGGRR